MATRDDAAVGRVEDAERPFPSTHGRRTSHRRWRPLPPRRSHNNRGTTTIREQLAKHRSEAVCARCHSRMDPPGFQIMEDEDKSMVFAWRLGAGVAWQFTPSLELSADYHFSRSANGELSLSGAGPIEAERELHSFIFGARVSF